MTLKKITNLFSAKIRNLSVQPNSSVLQLAVLDSAHLLPRPSPQTSYQWTDSLQRTAPPDNHTDTSPVDSLLVTLDFYKIHHLRM